MYKCKVLRKRRITSVFKVTKRSGGSKIEKVTGFVVCRKVGKCVGNVVEM